MEWIENQPVFFGEQDTCSDDVIPVQLVDNTDISQVQFRLAPCDGGQQLFTDPNFDDSSTFSAESNWSIVYNQLCASGATSLGTSTVQQFNTTKYYQFNITVDSISAGGAFSVALGGTDLGTITSVGTYTFYGFPIAVFSLTPLSISPDVTGSEICISEITSYEVLLNATIAIYDELGVYQTKINYIADPDQFVLIQDTLTITIDWAALSLSNDCYYLCLLNPCENTGGQNYSATITNPLFAGNTNGWSLEGDAVYFDESVDLGAGDYGFIYQNNVFNEYINQCVYVFISAITGSVVVSFGTAVVATITTTGTFKVCGVPVGELSIKVSVGAGSNAMIEDVRPITIDVLGNTIPYPTADYVCNSTSNTFRLADYTNACTLLINACNNSDSSGFIFNGSGFTPRVRLEAKIRQAKYPSERTIYEDSVGKKKPVYFSGRKAKNLCIDLQPEYIHDFLRLLAGFDNVYISNELYFVEDDEYNVIYLDENDNVGSVRLLVSKQTQNVKNKNCSDTVSICNLEVANDALTRTIDVGDVRTLSDGTARTLGL